MKFLYEYRTPDNEKHSGKISASDREAAYAALKSQGIKPCRFSEAPGFFNKLFGKGKRWMVIVVLGAGCLVLGVIASNALRTSHSALRANEIFDSPLRRQPIGDAAIIDEGIRTGWADVFELEGDRFLASFAVPGMEPAIRATTEKKLREALDAPSTKHQAPSTSLEERQIRAMVSGMKDELRDFLGEGGSVNRYCNRLISRQDDEIGFYARAKGELDEAEKSGADKVTLSRILDKYNPSLRKKGIRPLVMPGAR